MSERLTQAQKTQILDSLTPQAFAANPQTCRALKALLDETAEWERLYDLRGRALQRGCPKCGYTQAAIRPRECGPESEDDPDLIGS